MISDAIPCLESNTRQVAIPSALLMTIVLAVSFFGDGLRDAFAVEPVPLVQGGYLTLDELRADLLEIAQRPRATSKAVVSA